MDFSDIHKLFANHNIVYKTHLRLVLPTVLRRKNVFDFNYFLCFTKLRNSDPDTNQYKKWDSDRSGSATLIANIKIYYI